MKPRKYEIALPDGRVATRKSHRTYTHAVLCLGGNANNWFVARYCSRADLAEKDAQRRRSGNYYGTHYAEVRVVKIPPVPSGDPTEGIRREMVAEINTMPGGREVLSQEYPDVMDTDEVREKFEVLSFLAPFVMVRRKSDGVKGTLMFQHHPRFYFGFSADK